MALLFNNEVVAKSNALLARITTLIADDTATILHKIGALVSVVVAEGP